MTRLYPKKIQDKVFLSRLLEAYLLALEQSPLQVSVGALSFDSRIPESVFRRLVRLYRHPDEAPEVCAHDFHILFANIMFRYPTVRIWQDASGAIIFEM
jgi:Mn-dependent DtxR family transcriptional regulator